MFPRGPRFEPPKIPDVPGPNTYNLNQESQFDAYKKGAFLEKTDRFSKEPAAEVPGPGTYDSDARKASTKAGGPKSLDGPDRYAVLQRKVEDLEKIHHDGKKAHKIEMDRLKSELARSQKENADYVGRFQKSKKQNEILDARLQELKKAATVDQAEIKELRSKLRASEHEREELSAKQAQVGELRKATQGLELKRRDDLKERDKKIAVLEKSLSIEMRRREAVEVRLKESAENGDKQMEASDIAIQGLQKAVDEAHAKAQEAQLALISLEADAACKEDDLLGQLQHHRRMLGQVAEEYGRLAANTVPIDIHTCLQHRNRVLQMKSARLERKLANSEGQVVELANLIRQVKDDNSHLHQSLRDTEEEIHSYSAILADNALINSGRPDDALTASLDMIHAHISNHWTCLQNIDQRNTNLMISFYRIFAMDVLATYSASERDLSAATVALDGGILKAAQAMSAHDTIAIKLEQSIGLQEQLQRQLESSTATIAELRSAVTVLESAKLDMKQQMEQEKTLATSALQKEKAVTSRLTETIQKNRMAEESLRAEVEQLMLELADAEMYQEAYYKLSEEVGSLIARNTLAETESSRLSKFNAEILGHNNPAQRIMYVDRIRTELAETKQKLALLMHEHDTIVAYNANLQGELETYKSVVTPIEDRPRTNMIRVGRILSMAVTRTANDIPEDNPKDRKASYDTAGLARGCFVCIDNVLDICG
ncbi:hypothetical protein BD779DRAFT_1435431 [Infundibulicybe gibba]|nr:hypothetical protein BD779DRAFT_1435431 [Infundibulicybe gibba]